MARKKKNPANSAPEPATTCPPAAVKVVKTHGLPAIPFCIATAESPAVAFVGMSDFAAHRIDLGGDKPEPQPIGEARHGSYVTGIVRAGGTLVSGG